MTSNKTEHVSKWLSWVMLAVMMVTSLAPAANAVAFADDTPTTSQVTEDAAEATKTSADNTVNGKVESTDSKIAASDSSKASTNQGNAPNLEKSRANKETREALKDALKKPAKSDVALATDTESLNAAAKVTDNNGKVATGDGVTITIPKTADESKTLLDNAAKAQVEAIDSKEFENFVSAANDASLQGLDSISVLLWSTLNQAERQKGSDGWVKWVADLKAQAGFDTWSDDVKTLFLSGNVPLTASYKSTGDVNYVPGKSASDGFRLLVYIYSGAYAKFISPEQRAQIFNADGAKKFKDVAYLNLDEDIKNLNNAWDLQHKNATSKEVLSALVKVESLDDTLKASFKKDLATMNAESEKSTSTITGLIDRIFGVTSADAAENINNWSNGNGWVRNGGVFDFTGNSISTNTYNSAAGNGYVLAPNGRWYPAFCVSNYQDSGMNSVSMGELFSANSSGGVNRFTGSYLDGLGGAQAQRDFNNVVYAGLRASGVVLDSNTRPDFSNIGILDIIAGGINNSYFVRVGNPNSGQGALGQDFWNLNGTTTGNWFAQNWTPIMNMYNSMRPTHPDASSSHNLTVGKDDGGVNTGIAWPNGVNVPATSSDGSYNLFKNGNNIWIKPLKDSGGNVVTTVINVPGGGFGTQSGTSPFAYYDRTGRGQYRAAFIGYVGQSAGFKISVSAKTEGFVGVELTKQGSFDSVASPWAPTSDKNGVTTVTTTGADELGGDTRSQAIYQLLDKDGKPVAVADKALSQLTVSKGTQLKTTVSVGKTIADGAKYVYFKPAQSSDASINGHIKLEKLLYGSYSLKEVIAPNGYQIDKNEYKFGQGSASPLMTQVTSTDGILTFGFNGSKYIGLESEDNLWLGENGATINLTAIGGSVDTVAIGDTNKNGTYHVGKNAVVVTNSGDKVSTAGGTYSTKTHAVTRKGVTTKGAFEFRGIPSGAYMLHSSDAVKGYLEMENLIVVYRRDSDGNYHFIISKFTSATKDGVTTYTLAKKPLISYDSTQLKLRLPTQDSWDAAAGEDLTDVENNTLNREVFINTDGQLDALDRAATRSVKISTFASNNTDGAKNIPDTANAVIRDRIFIWDNAENPLMVHKSWKTGDTLEIKTSVMDTKANTIVGESKTVKVKYDSTKVVKDPKSGRTTAYVDIEMPVDASKIPGRQLTMFEEVRNIDDPNTETNAVIKETDITNTEQTVTVDEHPSIDVEKSNGNVPEAGNGNHSDKDDNVGENDHDTADGYFVIENGADTIIYFGITNNGSEALTNVIAKDATVKGSRNVENIVWTYKDEALSVDDKGHFTTSDGKLFVLPVGDRIVAQGVLSKVPAGELHGDEVSVSATGVISGKPVGDDDKWYGKTLAKPEISTQAMVDKKDNNTFTVGSKSNLGDRVTINGTSNGMTGKITAQLHLLPGGNKDKAKVIYETTHDVVAKGNTYTALIDQVFDTSKLEKGDVLVWTEVFDGKDESGTSVHAEHKDLTVKSQTLTPEFPKVPEVPKAPEFSETGVGRNMLITVFGVCALVGVGIYMYKRR